jgi:hypothetical protein
VGFLLLSLCKSDEFALDLIVCCQVTGVVHQLLLGQVIDPQAAFRDIAN